MVLSAGRPPPGDECSRRRCEGVAVVLNRDAADAWKNGGIIWTLVSSRVPSCRLQFELADGSEEWFTLVCSYAPTFGDSRVSK